jgi:hypothetical protein
MQTGRQFWSLFGILANAPDMRTYGRAPTLRLRKQTSRGGDGLSGLS